MALFTDGLANEIEDLVAYESSLLETAASEGIDLSVKLRLAQEEVGVEVERFLSIKGRAPSGLEHVVVDGAIRKWHAFRALALTYRDAYHSQLNDRYLGKWKEWERMAEWAREAAFDRGVGIVEKPIPKAEPPRVEVTAAGLPGGRYYLRVSWVDEEGNEGAASDPVMVVTEDGQGLLVRVGPVPPAALGWHVYAGQTAEGCRRQTETPLPSDGSWWLVTGELREGAVAGAGQKPDYRVSRSGADGEETGERSAANLLQRG